MFIIFVDHERIEPLSESLVSFSLLWQGEGVRNEFSQPITPSTLGNACYYVCEPLLASEVVLWPPQSSTLSYFRGPTRPTSRNCSFVRRHRIYMWRCHALVYGDFQTNSVSGSGLCVGKKKKSPPQRSGGTLRNELSSTAYRACHIWDCANSAYIYQS